jgi:cytochrome c-type biogenesis protein CcmE
MGAGADESRLQDFAGLALVENKPGSPEALRASNGFERYSKIELYWGLPGMRKYGKFAALIVIVIGTLAWLAASGMSGSQTYYKSISEMDQMGGNAYGKRLRVGGDVAAGSIQRVGKEVQFVLTQDKLTLKVAYTGSEPLPDTFRDGAQALADGKLDPDGVFRAAKIQAKCASKYEAKPGQLKPGQAPPNINAGKSAI